MTLHSTTLPVLPGVIDDTVEPWNRTMRATPAGRQDNPGAMLSAIALPLLNRHFRVLPSCLKMSLSKSSRKGATDLDVDTARLVVERLGPWSRAACACVNRTWKEAVERVSFPDTSSEHWLVGVYFGNSLWMYKLASGEAKKVEMDLPSTSRSTVLSTFQGLVLLCVCGDSKSGCRLLLGDPLLNKWINLPTPKDPRFYCPDVAAFCSATSTLMVTGNSHGFFTATFDFATAVWNVDGPCNCSNCDACENALLPVSQAFCLGGVFYCSFECRELVFAIACYDPVNDRRWRVVKTLDGFPVFVVAHSHDKMLIYMMRVLAAAKDDGDNDYEPYACYELFEANKASGSNELVIVPSPLMDDECIGRRIRVFRLGGPVFHGEEDLLFLERRDGKKTTVVSIKDGMAKDVDVFLRDAGHCLTKCYYRAVPGTAEVLEDLARKLELKRQK